MATARAGPTLRIIPNRATAMADSPTMTVAALAAMTPPMRPTARRAAPAHSS